MKIKIICVGKIKEKYLKDAIDEYKKRLSRFAQIEITELNDERIPDNPSKAEMDIVLKKEGDKILEKIGPSDYLITLCVEGKNLSSEELADKVSDICLMGSSTITFVIGGSLGIREDIKSLSKLRLSFSRMTFPHQLMRVILLEQIYRAFKINSNEEYHK